MKFNVKIYISDYHKIFDWQCKKISCVNTKRNKSVIVELQNITRKRFIPMTQFTTELLNFLAQKQDIDEFFRTSLETAMNDLL